MIFEIAGVAVALGAAMVKIDKAEKMDKKSREKNARAMLQAEQAQDKVRAHEQQLFSAMEINARRKTAILNTHIPMFMEQYTVFQQVRFEEGRGIEEIETIGSIRRQLTHYIDTPEFSPPQVMKDSQLAATWALRGIGGVAMKEAKLNAAAASRNMASSNVVAAQADSICISLDGIRERVEIVTSLLQRLGALYMLSIRELQRIVSENGTNAAQYTQADIDAINTSMYLTKLVYRIINTPLVDQEGKIEQAAADVIREGQRYLEQL